MKNLILATAGLLLSISASSQLSKPVKWGCAAKKTSDTTATVYITATLEEGWCLYSQNATDNGQVKISIAFPASVTYRLLDRTAQPMAITQVEKDFESKVRPFDKSVVFRQKIKFSGADPTVKASVEYMACNSSQCLPPETVEFFIPVK